MSNLDRHPLSDLGIKGTVGMRGLASAVFLLLLFTTGTATGEVSEDQIIFKTGDIVRGQIISQTGTSIRILTRDLRTETFDMDSILRITEERIGVKNPWKATALSFIYFSGFGQLYNGEMTPKGWVFFLWSFWSFYIPFSEVDSDGELSTVSKLSLGSYGVSMVVGAVDAYRSARRINRERFGLLYESGSPRMSIKIEPVPGRRIGARLAARF